MFHVKQSVNKRTRRNKGVITSTGKDGVTVWMKNDGEFCGNKQTEETWN